MVSDVLINSGSCPFRTWTTANGKGKLAKDNKKIKRKGPLDCQFPKRLRELTKNPSRDLPGTQRSKKHHQQHQQQQDLDRDTWHLCSRKPVAAEERRLDML
ncbi:hypothetical protein E2C01_027399 [Portunus trituberculatus]|uniref:Uncharacterized protein n=1 Tax=Portunus trituberculatus TaxID=210409 RepID=A0A5B7ELG1_PORTR|nr:hypothetical protein [Portunus trituberculatus]